MKALDLVMHRVSPGYILLFPVLSKNISAAKGESEHILF